MLKTIELPGMPLWFSDHGHSLSFTWDIEPEPISYSLLNPGALVRTVNNAWLISLDHTFPDAKPELIKNALQKVLTLFENYHGPFARDLLILGDI